jgi:uncharacterized membrane protein
MIERFSTEASRLEAFSDGVIAVIITIMVLDMRPPAGTNLHDLAAVARPFGAYLLSFVFVGIYWNNHHHMLRATSGIDGLVMWANLNLLFWLSLVPFATLWIGAHPASSGPAATYAALLLVLAISYELLALALIRVNGRDSDFAQAATGSVKGRISLVVYLIALIGAFFMPVASEALFVVVAIIWLVPDRRFERVIVTKTK